MTIAPHTMTLEEFLERYEEDPVLEYAQGVVTQKMAPSWDHSAVASVVTEQVNLIIHHRKLGYAFVELRTTDVQAKVSRVPDVAIYRWDRIERHLRTRGGGSQIPPDVAIEVASPGQSRQKQIERCHEFLVFGARAALMIDPRTSTIIDVRPGQPERRLRGDDKVDLRDVIPELLISVGELFTATRFE